MVNDGLEYGRACCSKCTANQVAGGLSGGWRSRVQVGQKGIQDLDKSRSVMYAKKLPGRDSIFPMHWGASMRKVRSSFELKPLTRSTHRKATLHRSSHDELKN